MAQPFTPDIATDLIREEPGRPASEIVRDALSRGIIGTRGEDPIAGQRGALVKMYLEGRLPDIRREESSRPYLYYPKRMANVDFNGRQSPTVQPSTQGITFRPSTEQDQVLTALVSVGAFSNRTDAIRWLLDQGITAKQDLIQRALETHKQIEHLRKGVKFEEPARV